MSRLEPATPLPLALRERQAAIATELLLADAGIRTQLQGADGRAAHAAQLKRVEEWIAAHLHEPVSRADLCAVAGLDVRTLSRAFRRSHDLSPMEFVRARRLDAVNRALLALEAAMSTVTSVAMDYGLHHPSHFAADHKRRFGELPVDTLRR